jgi:hypothetical protein
MIKQEAFKWTCFKKKGNFIFSWWLF